MCFSCICCGSNGPDRSSAYVDSSGYLGNESGRTYPSKHGILKGTQRLDLASNPPESAPTYPPKRPLIPPPSVAGGEPSSTSPRPPSGSTPPSPFTPPEPRRSIYDLAPPPYASNPPSPQAAGSRSPTHHFTAESSNSQSPQPPAPILNPDNPLTPPLPQAQHMSPAPHGSAPDSESPRPSGSSSMADGQAEEELHTGQTAEDRQTMERDSEAEIEGRRQDEERRRPDSLSPQPSTPTLNPNDPLAPPLPQAQHVLRTLMAALPTPNL
jgi:hypothetical protein